MTEIEQGPRTRLTEDAPRRLPGVQGSSTSGPRSFRDAPDLRRRPRDTNFSSGALFRLGPLTSSLPASPEETPELEEFWEATIEEIGKDAIRLHTRSRSGEEADAWLPLEKVPQSERRHIMLGAPMRISVFLQRVDKTRRRFEEIRVVRPDQWQAPVTAQGRTEIAETLLERMLATVTCSG